MATADREPTSEPCRFPPSGTISKPTRPQLAPESWGRFFWDNGKDAKVPRINQSTRAITGTRRSATTIPQLRATAPTKTMEPLAIGPSATASSANWSQTTTG
jgi:hypothetical protein